MSDKLTWRELTRREPALKELLKRAKAEGPKAYRAYHYCANNVWYSQFKPVLVHLVGWEARKNDPVLRSKEAYDLAYEYIYEKLPDCKRCLCFGGEGWNDAERYDPGNIIEQAYRRGCHQAIGMANRVLERVEDPIEAKAFLRRLEEELYRIRTDKDSMYRNLLHYAIERTKP